MSFAILWSLIIEKNFIVNELSSILILDNAFVIFCTILCLYSTFQAKGIIRQIAREEELHLLLVIISILITVPLFTKTFYTRSFMNILHNFSVKDEKIITAKIKKYSAFLCKNGISFEGYTFINGQICMSEGNRKKLLDVTEVKLRTKSSPFGFEVVRIEY
ncbi:MAG: hypothetical protein C0625_07160 [Arcobacter sp.]|nr:MAG: hypothetical protein C0625_07160 [Arcobacter sp.]